MRSQARWHSLGESKTLDKSARRKSHFCEFSPPVPVNVPRNVPTFGGAR